MSRDACLVTSATFFFTHRSFARHLCEDYSVPTNGATLCLDGRIPLLSLKEEKAHHRKIIDKPGAKEQRIAGVSKMPRLLKRSFLKSFYKAGLHPRESCCAYRLVIFSQCY